MSYLARFPILRALKRRAFLLVWGGQTLSRIGDFLYEVALAWWVLQKTGSATAMATVLIFAFAPMLLFLLLGGVAVDRLSRIRVMFWADMARGVAAGAVAILAGLDQLLLWQVYAASLIFGLMDAFFQPAYTAIIPEITTDEDLPSANSLTSLSIQLGRVGGPALGAALVSLGGSALAFGLNALTFLVAAGCLIPLWRLESAESVPPLSAPAPGLWNEVREGWRTVRDNTWLWLTILLFAVINVMLSGPYSVSLPFLVKEAWQADVKVLGLFYAIFPIGYILGGLWLGRQTDIRRRVWLIYGGSAAAGAMLGLFGLPIPLPILALAALVNGAALEVGNLAWTTTLQEKVPRDRLGRVASLDALGSYALLPVGYGLAGWATDAWGAPLVFGIGGGVTALLSLLILWRVPGVRALG